MDTETLLKNISQLLVKSNDNIAVAESVTSGNLQGLLSLAPDATCFYEGGVTTYNLKQKVNLLSVSRIHALRCNCVSATVAAQMARGVSSRFKSDFGIGITGYASPVPEINIYNRFAFYAIAHKGHVKCKGYLETNKEDAAAAQMDFSLQLLAILHECLVRWLV